MVVALFGLSLVMILGGIASVVQGFPYVRLESGLAMVIGGTTAASAGAVLLGLAAVVVRLKRVEEALGEMPSGAVPMPVSMPVALPREIGPLPSSIAPAAAGAAGLAGLTVGGAGLAAKPPPVPPREAEPVLPNLLPPGEALPAAPRPVEAPPPEPALPELPPEEDLFATTQPTTQPAEERDEPPPLRRSLDEAAPDDEAEPQAPAGDNPVVGTYASGANTYVMFADGTIEADTPRGRFTFRSLDELKAFVEAGGESDARGAA